LNLEKIKCTCRNTGAKVIKITRDMKKKNGVAVLEPYDKKPQLLTILLTPDYKELMFKYIKFICRDERIIFYSTVIRFSTVPSS